MSPFVRRRIARRGERGATLFVVILVIAMLTGIGLFAAQASTIATSTSGGARVSTQSRYFAEGAMNLVMSKLSKEAGVEVTLLAKTSSTACLGQKVGALIDPTYQQCLRYTKSSVAKQLWNSSNANEIFTPYDPQAGTHGSLGRLMDGEADFLVEMDDLYRIERPIAGFDYTSAGAANVHFMSVMLHGMGRVRLVPGGDENLAKTLSSTTFRSGLIVGPMTGP